MSIKAAKNIARKVSSKKFRRPKRSEFNCVDFGSKHEGVRFNMAKQKFCIVVELKDTAFHDGVKVSSISIMGNFNTEREAAKEYKRVVKKLGIHIKRRK